MGADCDEVERAIVIFFVENTPVSCHVDASTPSVFPREHVITQIRIEFVVYKKNDPPSDLCFDIILKFLVLRAKTARVMDVHGQSLVKRFEKLIDCLEWAL